MLHCLVKQAKLGIAYTAALVEVAPGLHELSIALVPTDDEDQDEEASSPAELGRLLKILKRNLN